MKRCVISNKIMAAFCMILLLIVSLPIVSFASTSLRPLICIDTPQNNSRISLNTLSVVGWSLSSSGVQKVQIVIDNNVVQNATIGLSRDDVNRVYPGYSGGANSGYSANVDISALTLGAHILTVKSIGNDGIATSQSTTIYKVSSNGKNMQQYVDIDTPTYGTNVNGISSLTVSGWSLNGYGIQSVQVYVDNSNETNATVGISRADVDKALPGYVGGTTSGYSANVKLISLANGEHTIKVVSIGNDGSQAYSTIVVKNTSNSNMPGRICIDTPQSNSKISGNTLNVVGWSLDPSGVQKVQVAIDNNVVQNATTGLSRGDVNRALPGYPGGVNSGYSANIDISGLSEGNHTLTVSSTGNDGVVTSQSVTVYRISPSGKNMQQYVDIDTPTYGSNIGGATSLTVSGWSLNGYGVQSVQVYVDGSNKTSATIGILRPDVDRALPGYVGGTTSGYSTSVKLPSLTEGNHTLKVVSTGNDGSQAYSTIVVKKVTEQSMPGRICIDTPQSNSKVSGNTLNVVGWSLNPSGVQKVQVAIDNNVVQNATIGLSRGDVDQAYPGYLAGANSGYSANVNVASLTTGVHKLTVISTGNDGVVTSENLEIYKLAAGATSMPTKSCIDTPVNGTFYKSQSTQVNVVGWALDAFGIQKVQICVDNNFVGNAATGLSRGDVDQAYPGYTGGANSGFSYSLNLSNFSDGAHTLSVRSYGNDGDSSVQNIMIYKFSGNGQATMYNISLDSAVSLQMKYGQPVYESNGNWVSANSSTVKYYMDPTNFMDQYGVYQFLRLDYMQGVTVSDLNNILAGKGVLAGKGAQFLAAAQQSNINPVYLVSHALLETGNGQSALATGIVVNGKTTYNLFGIGAYDSNPNQMGAQYAYNQGWFSVDEAIYGGSNWIAGSYINNSSYKQNTLYKMRWNPASPTNHQYATDVRWAYNQITNIKALIDKVQNPSLQFDIPQYN